MSIHEANASTGNLLTLHEPQDIFVRQDLR